MLSTEGEFAAFADIVVDAYPALFDRSPESRRKLTRQLRDLAETEPAITFWGLFRPVKGQERLLGGMRLFDFQMNLLDTQVPLGAVGQVGVALEHRREHVGRDLMLFYLRHYRQRGAPLTALYPFRPDFYRSMGFGYGTKMSRYKLDPATLPASGDRSLLRRLGAGDREALQACYTRYAHQTHGMIDKIDHELDRLFEAHDRRIVGYEREGRLEGYLVFTYESGGTYLAYDLRVSELIHETREALKALLTFLHTHDDQIRRVILTTQDTSLHHMFDDPRDGSDVLISPVYHSTDVQGVGIMYRVVDVPRVFRLLASRNFGGQTCRMKLRVKDTFLPENDGSHLLEIRGGQVTVVDEMPYDVTVEIDISVFSSLLVGTVTFERLYAYSLVEISDPAFVDTVSRIFSVARKPICTTSF